MTHSQTTKSEKMIKVFTSLSGGVDSTTTLAIAASEFPDALLECVTFDYGQRHKKEAEYAYFQSKQFGAAPALINISGVLTGMLVDKGDNNEAIPNVDYADLPHGISPTYVSFRNGTMLSLLAARAQAWVMDMEKAGASAEAVIYCGVHADDGVNWAYPDCTPEFIGPMSAAIYVGTYHKVTLRAPLLYMTKAAVVREGLRLGVNYVNTWSCYKGEDVHCGTCPTCRSRKQAFIDNGVTDPTEYAA